MRRLALALAFCAAQSARAQTATFRGRVLSDSTERPVAGATVALDALRLQAVSDSLGDVVITGITPGTHLLEVRRIGFTPISSRVTFTAGATVEADLLIAAITAQPMPEVLVATRPVARGKMAEFEERRSAGVGRFLTQAELESRSFSTMANTLRALPGMSLVSAPGGAWYAAAGRLSLPGCALCGAGRSARESKACLLAVMIDGQTVYGTGDPNEPKFDVNVIDPRTLAGVEFYVGPASIPARYNATRSTCGLLMLWTK
jgi:hypothetical protein